MTVSLMPEKLYVTVEDVADGIRDNIVPARRLPDELPIGLFGEYRLVRTGTVRTRTERVVEMHVETEIPARG